MMTAEGAASDYDTDILLWSERQADLLRRHAAGERIKDAWIDVVAAADGRSRANMIEQILLAYRRERDGRREAA